MHWLRIILALLGMVCFIILLLSTIFDFNGVRTDLLKHEGSIQVKDWFSVRGVTLILLLVLCLAFPLSIFWAPHGKSDSAQVKGWFNVRGVTLILLLILGVGFIAFLSHRINQLTAKDESCKKQKETLSEKINQLTAKDESCKKQKETLSEKINQLKDSQLSNDTVVTWVRGLKPDSDAAKKIRSMATDGQGPWAPPELLISVHSGVGRRGNAEGCFDYYEKDLKLYYPPEDKTLDVKVGTLMAEAENCREWTKPMKKEDPDKRHDIKINCTDANFLFGESVLLGCHPNGEPKWNGGYRILRVRASLVSTAQRFRP